MARLEVRRWINERGDIQYRLLEDGTMQVRDKVQRPGWGKWGPTTLTIAHMDTGVTWMGYKEITSEKFDPRIKGYAAGASGSELYGRG